MQIGKPDQTLVCTVELRSNIKQASWNVKGKEPSQLHALEAYADLMAERTAMLGAMGTACTTAVQSTLWGSSATSWMASPMCSS